MAKSAKKEKSGGAEQRFSMRREHATDGGGMDGAVAKISVECVGEFTYGGQQKDNPQAAIRVVYKVKGMEKPWEEHYTFGPADRYEVVLDGRSVKPTGKAKGINRKSGAYFFIDAVQNAIDSDGLDPDEILPEVEDEDGVLVTDLGELDGKTVRVGMMPFTNYSGDSKDRAAIASFNVEGAAPAKGGAKKAVKVVEDDDEGEPDSDDEESGDEDEADPIDAGAESLITKVVKAAKKAVPIKDLGGLVYRLDKENEDIKAIMKLAANPVWVGSPDRPDAWTVDKKKGTVALAK